MHKRILFLIFSLLRIAHATQQAVLRPETSPTISWTTCDEDLKYPPEFRCTSLQVPLDWSDPTGPTISLHINIAPATRPEKRIGSLLANPGGPGGNAAAFIKRIYDVFAADVNEVYDLIGVNPRGVYPSSAIRCSPDLWNERVSHHPTSEKEYNTMIEHWERLAEDCLNQTGLLFYNVDTISAVRDLEAVRIALGEGQLNFWGFSYGTQLGSQYAALYPKNLGRFVLDANVDHSADYINMAVAELTGYETVLTHFLEWAAANETSALYGNDTAALFDDLVENANKHSIPAPDCRQDRNASEPCLPEVTGQDIRMALFNIYLSRPREEWWPKSAQALLEAWNGNGSALSMPFHTEPTHIDFSMNAIGCQDWSTPSSYEEFVNLQTLTNSVSPHLQSVVWSVDLQAMCIGWQKVLRRNGGVKNLPKLLQVRKPSARVLLVNALWDPQTPYEWAVALQRRIEGSVLITRRGYGHGSLMQQGGTQGAVNRYLIDGEVPEAGMVFDT